MNPLLSNQMSLLMLWMFFLTKNLQENRACLEMDTQNGEAGADKDLSKSQGSKSGSYVYVVKQTPSNGFLGFLQIPKPVPTTTRTVSGEVYRHSVNGGFVFSKRGKGIVKISDVVGYAFITLLSINIDNDRVTISEADYFKVPPCVRQDNDLFEDEIETEESNIEGTVNTYCDEQLAQDSEASSDDEDANSDQYMQLSMGFVLRTRTIRAPRRFDDFLAQVCSYLVSKYT